MLIHLSIKNYALIKHLEMDFDVGFTVITGETGAGKSILLGALGLVLGNRADTSILFDKKNKCIVESSFEIKDYNLQQFFLDNDLDYEEIAILRREINPQGKSRGFINDSPVNLALLKDLGDRLVNIHSQHQTITLNDSNFQLAVIDQFAGLHEKISAYKSLFSDYTLKLRQYKHLTEQESSAVADRDYLNYQLEELEKARLTADEQETIEKELDMLSHADQIKTTLLSSINALSRQDRSILDMLSEIKQHLGKIAPVHAGVEMLHRRLESAIIELDDIAREIEILEEEMQVDPRRAEELKARLDLIYQLEHKHRVDSIGELIELTGHIRAQIDSISSLGEQVLELEKEIAEKSKFLHDLAQDLSKQRKAAMPVLIKEILGIISELGMPQASMSIAHEGQQELGKDGLDNVKFLFNSNMGGSEKEIAKIASGGELSRLMLAIKSLISARNLLPTIIFDEIDAGVSGDIAGRVGKILKSMTPMMQVIVITHLPQIAGKGDHHYRVYKDLTDKQSVTRISKLDEEGRVEEIAKLLSDENITRSAVDAARELLDVKKN